MTRPVAAKFVFARLVEYKSFVHHVARFCLQAKAERRHNNAMLRFGRAVIEDECHSASGWDPNRRGSKLEFRGNDFDFDRLSLGREVKVVSACA
jgi:hypothetical protein